MWRSEGCAGWVSASEANGTHRCVSCELVPPVVFQAEQWSATRKPGDRDRDALILLPLDARQKQTAGRGGATADGVAFDAIEFVAEFPGDGSGMRCCRRMLPRSLQPHRFRRRPGAGPRPASRCRCPGPVAQTEPGGGAGLANDRLVASGEGFAGRRSGRLRRLRGPGPGRPPTSSRGACSAAAPPNARSAGGRPLRDTGKGAWSGSWIPSAARSASWPSSWSEGCRNSRCGVFRRNQSICQCSLSMWHCPSATRLL